MSVAAVVVTFNRLEKLKTVLASIAAQTHPVETLFVIDNASTDGTAEYLAGLELPVPVEVVTMATNSGA
ncbi:glycosyltransferase, partial [Enterococcus faecium]|uniref:glycosyltransferase n=1 Tax=Enterococcus faecium TaxID=1352 RepID=UPI0030C8068B